MSNETTNTRRPSHRLYTVQGEGQNATWTPVGAAWPDRDGNGYTLSLDAIPLDGRIQMRIPRHKSAE